MVVNSVYSYIWDIKMDWGLFDKNAGENKFLREEVVYSSNVSIRDYCHYCISKIVYLLSTFDDN